MSHDRRGLWRPPAPQPAVYLCPHNPWPERAHEQRYYVYSGTRSEFNTARCALIAAAFATMQARPNSDVSVRRQLRGWTQRQQLMFKSMPRMVEGDKLHALNAAKMIGVYWFALHADTDGTLSPGQVLDLRTSLNVVKAELVGPDPRVQWNAGYYDCVMALLDYCLAEHCPLQFCAEGNLPRQPPRPDMGVPDKAPAAADSLLQRLTAMEYDPERPNLSADGAETKQ